MKKRGSIQRILRTLSVATVVLLSASASFALERTQALFLQYTLKQHGFDVGKADGVLGRNTRKQIKLFSKHYHSPDNPEDLFNWIIKKGAESREEIKSTTSLKEIKSKVSENLKDPSSAKFRKVRFQNGPSGKIVCGEVNGKNSYGAYSGYTSFMSVGSFNDLFSVYYIDDDSYGVAFYTCITSFPRK